MATDVAYSLDDGGRKLLESWPITSARERIVAETRVLPGVGDFHQLLPQDRMEAKPLVARDYRKWAQGRRREFPMRAGAANAPLHWVDGKPLESFIYPTLGINLH
jgi:hypothetical protein